MYSIIACAYFGLSLVQPPGPILFSDLRAAESWCISLAGMTGQRFDADGSRQDELLPASMAEPLLLRESRRDRILFDELASLDDGESGSETSYPRFFWQKSMEVFGAPLHWRSGDWLHRGVIIAGLALASSNDSQVSDFARRTRSPASEIAFDQVGRFGEEYSLAVMGGFWLAGKVFRSDRASRVARDSITSSILAAGLITPALKAAVGRDRPRDSNDSDALRPFGGGNSFPSGHTTQAFAIAGSIANNFPQRWVKITSYSLASLVGFSRIETDAHYFTDVAAGALIGTWVSRKVTGKDRRNDRIWWEPYLGTEGLGLSLKFQDR